MAARIRIAAGWTVGFAGVVTTAGCNGLVTDTTTRSSSMVVSAYTNGNRPAASSDCRVGRCTPLPAPVTCETTSCTGRAFHLDAVTLTTVAPCCAAGGGCGLDVSSLYFANDRCQPLNQPAGVNDATCPGYTGSGPMPLGALRPCRRPDGKCGFSLDEVGLGCVLDPLAP